MDPDIEQCVARTTEALSDASGFDHIVRKDAEDFDKAHPSHLR